MGFIGSVAEYLEGSGHLVRARSTPPSSARYAEGPKTRREGPVLLD